MKKLITVRITLTTTLLIMMAPSAIKGVWAQSRGGPPEPPASPRAAARIDITGYWVSLITEDWRYRQFTPPKGDHVSVPLNPAGKKIADAWDPAKDEAAGEQCKAYGAEGRDDETQAGIFAQKWRALQRPHRLDRVLRPIRSAWRRRHSVSDFGGC